MNNSDAKSITFKASVRAQKYGDRRTFMEFRILMFHKNRLVGIEDGPRRETTTRPEAIREARRRITALKSRRLFVIRITRKHISDGEARSCNTCAIAQAIWHNQERMGFPKRIFSFEISPYGGMFSEARGIVIGHEYRDEPDRHIQADELPKLAIGVFNGRAASEDMATWAMNFDDWAEYRSMSAREWRESKSDDLPSYPGTCSFVLDVDAFVGCAQ